ncbi:MAG: hypothetical protein FWE90_06200 [Defluviitaleaceae bacterium]|nr:hypothetical protein [Defluviitaleaceae bacterium]
MKDSNVVFDDIMQGLHEIEEFEKGNIELRLHKIETSDDEIENNQLMWHKFYGLPEAKKRKVVSYINELLEA